MNELETINKILDYAEKTEKEIIEVTKDVDLELEADLKIDVASQKYYGELNKRGEIITKILTAMFGNGVVIEGELSVRRGAFYPYKCHSKVGLPRVKKNVLENLHEVLKDVKEEENKDILEFCLDRIHEENYSASYWNEEIKQDIESKEVKLGKVFKVIRNRSEYGEEATFEIVRFNKIVLNHEGGVFFVLSQKGQKEKGTYRSGYKVEDSENTINMPDGFKKLLMVKFAKEIEGLRKGFEDELTPKIAEVEKDIDELKVRGGKLLILSHLTQKVENEDNPI